MRSWDGLLRRGTITVERTAELRLVNGQLGTGNGYEAATATGAEMTVTAAGRVATVTMQVLNTRESGRRVGFVEVRLAASPPVRWEEEKPMGQGTEKAPAAQSAGLRSDSGAALKGNRRPSNHPLAS